MKLTPYIEKLIDYTTIILCAFSLNYWFPWFCAIIISISALFVFFKAFAKTPGMLFTMQSLSESPSVKLFFKSILGFGNKNTAKEKKGTLKIFSGILIIILNIAAAIYTSSVNDFSIAFEGHHKNKGWEYYISEDRGFTVQFPHHPIVETKQIYIADADKTLNYSEYVSEESPGALYTVSFMDFPSKWRFVGSKRLLSTAFEQLVKNDSGIEIISQTFIQHKIFPAIEFSLKKGQEEIRGRMILVGNTFYKITHINSSGSSANEEQFESFLNSFQFPLK